MSLPSMFNTSSLSGVIHFSVNNILRACHSSLQNQTSDDDDFSKVATALVALAVIGLAISYVRRYFYMGMGSKCLPYAPMSFRDLIKLAMTPESVFGTLDMVRQDESLLNCRLRIPVPKGFYVIGDYKVQRQILMNSDKPTELYQQYWFAKSKADVFFSAQSSHHQMVRKSAAHFFTSREIRPMSARCLECLESILKPKFDNVAAEGGTIDIRDEVLRFVFDLFMDIAYEYDTDDTDFAHFQETYGAAKMHVFQDSKRLLSFVSKFYIPWLRTRFGETIRDFVERVYDSYVANPHKSDRNTLIRIIHENEGLSYHEKIDELLFFTFAGHETTGTISTSTLVLLAKHPQVAQKLRDELSTVDSIMDFKNNEYLHWVMNEAMRMMPLGTVNRKPSTDIVVKGTNYVIPKGSICMLPQILTTRNHKVFADPDSFIPERWANPTKEMQESLMPFAMGKRSCIGRSLAMAEMELIIPFMIQNYHLSVARDEGAYDVLPFINYDKVQLRCTPISK